MGAEYNWNRCAHVCIMAHTIMNMLLINVNFASYEPLVRAYILLLFISCADEG